MATMEKMGGYIAGLDRRCDWPGCGDSAGFAAPKARAAPTDRHWFCLDHIRIYNAEYDALKGLSAEEIAAVQAARFTWERPVWRLGERGAQLSDPFGLAPDALKAAASPEYRRWTYAERAALQRLGLDEQATPAEIRKTYKQLVKAHHPDLNKGVHSAAFSAIIAAYDILKPRLRGKPAR